MRMHGALCCLHRLWVGACNCLLSVCPVCFRAWGAAVRHGASQSVYCVFLCMGRCGASRCVGGRTPPNPKGVTPTVAAPCTVLPSPLWASRSEFPRLSSTLAANSWMCVRRGSAVSLPPSAGDRRSTFVWEEQWRNPVQEMPLKQAVRTLLH